MLEKQRRNNTYVMLIGLIIYIVSFFVGGQEEKAA